MTDITYTPTLNYSQIIREQVAHANAQPIYATENKLNELIGEAAQALISEIEGAETNLDNWRDRARHCLATLTMCDLAARKAWHDTDRDACGEIVSLVVSLLEVPADIAAQIPPALVEFASTLDQAWGKTHRYVTRMQAVHRRTMKAHRKSLFLPPDEPFTEWGVDACQNLFHQIQDAYQKEYQAKFSTKAISDALLLGGHCPLIPSDRRANASQALRLIHVVHGHTASEQKFTQAADAFVNAFNLKLGSEPEQLKGCLILHTWACTDDYQRKWNKVTRYTYNAKDNLIKTVRAFHRLLELMLPTDEGAAIVAEVEAFISAMERNGWSPAIINRYRLQHTDVRLFKDKVKFHIPLPIASDINAFLTRWAPQFQRQ